MSLTNEQIDAAIAALTALKAQPRVSWLIRDKDGDFAGLLRTEQEARRDLGSLNRGGSFRPYTLYRCVEEPAT